jgi:hypothetical protein
MGHADVEVAADVVVVVDVVPILTTPRRAQLFSRRFSRRA